MVVCFWAKKLGQPNFSVGYRKGVDGDTILDIYDSVPDEDAYFGPMGDHDGYILYYAINNRNSFDILQHAFYPRILETKGERIPPMVLIGNKCDLEQERQVTTAEGEELARRFNASFLETSALNRINIDEAFRALIPEMRLARSYAPVHDHLRVQNKKRCKLT